MNKEELIELLEPTVNALGYELVDLDLKTGRGALLRLFIDREPAVNLADCEHVSEQIGDWLDVEDPLPGGYTLEVSSPGLDRRLRKPEHFSAVLGSEIRVELKRVMEGRRRFRGELRDANQTHVVMTCDGVEWRLSLEDIQLARLVRTD